LRTLLAGESYSVQIRIRRPTSREFRTRFNDQSSWVGYIVRMWAWLGVFASLSFLGAAFFALRGTNRQAQMARQDWLADRNPDICAAAQLWAPGPRWIRRKSYREKRRAVEDSIARDSAEWARYRRLSNEFYAWNNLETSVAIAFPAALLTALIALFSAPH
jgi:hypothetical protein